MVKASFGFIARGNDIKKIITLNESKQTLLYISMNLKRIVSRAQLRGSSIKDFLMIHVRRLCSFFLRDANLIGSYD